MSASWAMLALTQNYQTRLSSGFQMPQHSVYQSKNMETGEVETSTTGMSSVAGYLRYTKLQSRNEQRSWIPSIYKITINQ